MLWNELIHFQCKVFGTRQGMGPRNTSFFVFESTDPLKTSQDADRKLKGFENRL
jgi:hypothetical protein